MRRYIPKAVEVGTTPVAQDPGPQVPQRSSRPNSPWWTRPEDPTHQMESYALKGAPLTAGPRLLFIPQWQRPLSYPEKAACAILKANFSTSPHNTRVPLVRVRGFELGSAHLVAVSASTLSRGWT